MKRKIYLAVIAVLLLIAISVPAAFAAQNGNPTPPFAAPGITNQVNLTDAQKSDLKQLFDKMLELRKQIIQKYVDAGALTKEDADYRLNRMQEMQKYREQNGFVPGSGRGFGGPGMGGRGMYWNSTNQQPQTTN